MASRFLISKPEVGQRWRHRDQGPSWQVVSIKDGVIGLSGPGPARGLRSMSVNEFLTEWVHV